MEIDTKTDRKKRNRTRNSNFAKFSDSKRDFLSHSARCEKSNYEQTAIVLKGQTGLAKKQTRPTPDVLADTHSTKLNYNFSNEICVSN